MDGAKGKTLGVRVSSLSPQAIWEIKEALTFDNPSYDPIRTPDEPTMLTAYEEEGGVLYLPRSFPLAQYARKPLVIQDRLSDGEPIKITTNITPEPYQERPITALSSVYNEGVLVAPCGAGKTVMGIKVIANRGRKALVLVMTEFLMTQWAEEILKFTDATIGFIGGGPEFRLRWRYDKRVVAPDKADITIATIQTLTNGVGTRFASEIGTIIGDEGHHAAARTYMNVMRMFKPRHMYLVTATPRRRDGLERIYYYFVGKIVTEVKQEELRQHKRTVMPKIQFVLTNLFHHINTGDRYNHAIALRILCASPDRNKMILDLAQKSEEKGRWTLVLSERVKHCLHLANEYKARGGDCCAVVGSVPKDLAALAHHVESMDEAFTHRVVFATYALVSEGLNQKQLNTLVLATPFSSEARTVQAIGRVARAMEDKTGALVFDLVDGAKTFQRMALKREIACQAQGWVTKWIKGV